MQIKTPDTAPINVGYESSVYNASEGEMEVSLCAVITNPPTGIAPRPFTLLFSVELGSEGR